jgi:hypothetical protein
MALMTLLVMLGPNRAGGGEKKALGLALCAPDQQRFTLDIDNAFFPLPVGGQWVLVGDDDGETIGVRITVFDQTEPFVLPGALQQPVMTRVVEETEWQDANGNGILEPGEDLIEVSRNYFAQTLGGTVCYFGEEVDIYEDGVVVSHEGAWRADAPGNAPGIFMPAEPQAGMAFQQEAAPEVAEDEARVVGSGPVTVPAGRFRDTIRLREFNPLDGGTGYKVFARDIGLVRDSGVGLVSSTLLAGGAAAAGARTASWASTPTVIEPADGDALPRRMRATLSWTAVPGAARYGVEFSGAGTAFTNPNGAGPDRINGVGGAGGGFVVSGTSVTIAVPAEAAAGRYQVRVIGLTGAGQPIGAFGDAITVTVP